MNTDRIYEIGKKDIEFQKKCIGIFEYLMNEVEVESREYLLKNKPYIDRLDGIIKELSEDRDSDKLKKIIEINHMDNDLTKEIVENFNVGETKKLEEDNESKMLSDLFQKYGELHKGIGKSALANLILETMTLGEGLEVIESFNLRRAALETIDLNKETSDKVNKITEYAFLLEGDKEKG